MIHRRAEFPYVAVHKRIISVDTNTNQAYILAECCSAAILEASYASNY